MRMPGFTAEASLYQTSTHYNMARVLDSLADCNGESRVDTKSVIPQ